VIQTLMFFSLGFLTAILLTLAVIPLVHNRAERLTLRRLEASIPLSIAQVHIRKDELRAEFAMATRRQEMRIEQLRVRTASLSAELAKKDAATNRLKVELAAKRAALSKGNEQEITFAPGTNNGFFANAKPSMGASTLVGPQAEIVRLNAELDERSRTADSQRIEIVALKIQIEALNERIANPRKAADQQRIELDGRRTGLRLAS